MVKADHPEFGIKLDNRLIGGNGGPFAKGIFNKAKHENNSK
jgi:hypothetical protein